MDWSFSTKIRKSTDLGTIPDLELFHLGWTILFPNLEIGMFKMETPRPEQAIS
jgi:hypothetical protein